MLPQGNHSTKYRTYLILHKVFIFRENVLRTLLTEIIEETNALRNLSRQFGDNVTLAELATEDLSLQIGTIQNQSLELEALVETLTVQVSEILPEQLSDIQRLYQELTIEVNS